MGDRLERERSFPNEAFVGGIRVSLSGYYSITTHSVRQFEALIEARANGSMVLEYGCGIGSHAIALSRLGAQVLGIDISDQAIRMAREAALAGNVRGRSVSRS